MDDHGPSLAQEAAALAAEVAGLRADVHRNRGQVRALALLLLVSVAFGSLAYLQQRSNAALSKRQHDQALALAVAVCAMQNVGRLTTADLLASAYNERIFDDPDQSDASVRRDEFLLRERSKLAELVPCETLVAGSKVRIELRYPTTVAPGTTTTRPS